MFLGSSSSLHDLTRTWLGLLPFQIPVYVYAGQDESSYRPQRCVASGQGPGDIRAYGRDVSAVVAAQL